MAEGENSTTITNLEKVCNFLRGRGQHESVILRFQSEKMDTEAVVHATDDLLQQMGLEQAGDRLSLKAFCTKECERRKKEEGEDTKKKRFLLESFIRKKDKKLKPVLSSKKPVEKTRKIELGWKHFKGSEEGYVLVPLAKGGGTRTLSLSLSSNRLDIISEGKSLFFPNGDSIYGRVEDMTFSLSNFRDEEVGLFIESGKRQVAFNIRNYIEVYKAKTVRLYLRSKFDEDSDDDLMPMLEPRRDTLIGTSAERAALRQRQDKEYEDSLTKDKVKRESRNDILERETQSVQQKKEIRQARMARVPPEPSECFVTVRVRHVTMGIQERKFQSSSLMSSVYDWVGSLCDEPENFTLCDAFGLHLHPSHPIQDRSLISMVLSDETPSLCWSDSEIQFKGFGCPISESDNTLEDFFPWDPNRESPNPALSIGNAVTMENDSLSVMPAQLLIDDDLRQHPEREVQPQGQLKRSLKVHRLNVKREMIDIFKDSSIINDDLEIVIIDSRGMEEPARGSGVLRDTFSLFWKEVYDSLFIGENERVPFVRHDYQRDEWEAVGRILVKGFRSCQYWPVLMSQTFVAYLLWGESAVTGVMLIESFKNYVASDEKKLIEKCLSGSIDFEGPDVLEMLSSYDCRSRVNSENVAHVFEEIAHKELIQKPQYIIDCWKGIVDHILPSFPNLESLAEKYETLVPSISRILSCIEANPGNDAERESLKFLKKFIKGLDTPQKLSTFVRFVSGSELMLFGAIQVQFTDLSRLGRRPIAHTCNTILEIPSTYQSYPELREEFSNILSSDNWEMDIL